MQSRFWKFFSSSLRPESFNAASSAAVKAWACNGRNGLVLIRAPRGKFKIFTCNEATVFHNFWIRSLLRLTYQLHLANESLYADANRLTIKHSPCVHIKLSSGMDRIAMANESRKGLPGPYARVL